MTSDGPDLLARVEELACTYDERAARMQLSFDPVDRAGARLCADLARDLRQAAEAERAARAATDGHVALHAQGSGAGPDVEALAHLPLDAAGTPSGNRLRRRPRMPRT